MGKCVQTGRSEPPVLPIQKVTGVVRVKGLTSLRNFPQHIGRGVTISDSENLQSLESEHEIIAESEFSVIDCGIRDLAGCKIVTDSFKFVDNTHFANLNGFEGRMKKLVLTNTPSFNDMSIINNTRIEKNVFMMDADFPHLKLCQLLVMDKNKKLIVKTIIDSIGVYDSQRLKVIIDKYQGAGAKAYINLLNELKDAGFSEMAKRG